MRPQTVPLGQAISSASRTISMSRVPSFMHLARTIKPRDSRVASLVAAATYRTAFGWRRVAQEYRKRTGSGRFSAPDVCPGGPWRVSRRGGSTAEGSLPRREAAFLRQLCLCRVLDRTIAQRRQRERAKGAPRQLLDIAQVGPLLVAAERDRDPGGA